MAEDQTEGMMANQTATDLKVQADMAWKAYERNPNQDTRGKYWAAATVLDEAKEAAAKVPA